MVKTNATNFQCPVPTKGSMAMTDGSFRLRNADGDVVFHILILEVKEDWGEGGGSHPVMQIISYYTMYLLDRVRSDSWAARSSCLPALAIELYGNSFR